MVMNSIENYIICFNIITLITSAFNIDLELTIESIAEASLFLLVD